MNIHKYACGILLVALLSSCNKISEDVSFGVMLSPDNTYLAGDEVTFLFDGNPDYIILWSGDLGHEYKYRDRTEYAPDDIESCKIRFTVDSKYGAKYTKTLTLMATSGFPGLAGNNKDADHNLLTIFNGWETVISQEEFPAKTGNGSTNVVTETYEKDIDVSKYASDATFAFRYQTGPLVPNESQRTWKIFGFSLETVYKNGVVYSLTAADMGFSAFDMLPQDLSPQSGNAYFNGKGMKGTWNLTDTKNIEIQGCAKTPAWENDDWLISSNLQLNGCEPDKSEVIKNINVRLDSYSHIYNVPGTYTVTFIAGNSNIYGESKVMREITFKVKSKN